MADAEPVKHLDFYLPIPRRLSSFSTENNFELCRPATEPQEFEPVTESQASGPETNSGDLAQVSDLKQHSELREKSHDIGISNFCEANCSLCKHIKYFRKNSPSWCFQWLRELKDWNADQEYADKEHQIHFLPNYSDDKISQIRIKLGILQTKTVGGH